MADPQLSPEDVELVARVLAEQENDAIFTDPDWAGRAFDVGRRRYELKAEGVLAALASAGGLRQPGGRLIGALADCVVKATEYGEQDGGFVAAYIMPTGPIHRAIPLLQEFGVTVRPGFDGRQQTKDTQPASKENTDA